MIAALAALAAVAAAAPAGDAALLPADGAIAGWARAGEARVFVSEQLYDHIDGGAEIFLEFGFVAATVQRYTAGRSELVVECYRMRDPDAALGIYLGKCGAETPAPGLGDRHTAGRYQLVLVRDRYVLILGNPDGAPAGAAAMVEFARAIASRLPPATPSRLLDALPKEGRVAGSERIVRGPVGLAAIVTLGDGDVLELGGRASAVAAAYEGPSGRSWRLLADYPDRAAAAAALDHVAAHLDRELAPLERTPARLVFRDFDGRFGVLALDGARLTLRTGLATIPSTP